MLTAGWMPIVFYLDWMDEAVTYLSMPGSVIVKDMLKPRFVQNPPGLGPVFLEYSTTETFTFFVYLSIRSIKMKKKT